MIFVNSDEGDTSSSSSEDKTHGEPDTVIHLAPPPSPIFPEVRRKLSEVKHILLIIK